MEYELFQSLFLNLIDNALKAGAECIEITGSAEKKENAAAEGKSEFCYAVRVKDNGSGIPAHEIKRITEAFYMVDKSRSRKQHGAGIGLALCEKIARIHGSRLEFESDGRSWTRVSVYLGMKGAENEE